MRRLMEEAGLPAHPLPMATSRRPTEGRRAGLPRPTSPRRLFLRQTMTPADPGDLDPAVGEPNHRRYIEGGGRLLRQPRGGQFLLQHLGRREGHPHRHVRGHLGHRRGQPAHVETMAERLEGPRTSARACSTSGAGYGGSARYLRENPAGMSTVIVPSKHRISDAPPRNGPRTASHKTVRRGASLKLDSAVCGCTASFVGHPKLAPDASCDVVWSSVTHPALGREPRRAASSPRRVAARCLWLLEGPAGECSVLHRPVMPQAGGASGCPRVPVLARPVLSTACNPPALCSAPFRTIT